MVKASSANEGRKHLCFFIKELRGEWLWSAELSFCRREANKIGLLAGHERAFPNLARSVPHKMEFPALLPRIKQRHELAGRRIETRDVRPFVLVAIHHTAA
jgi:hypothetical protein